MENWLARSMQIAILPTEEDLKAIQKRENELGYIIPNWNIQELLHIPTIREVCDIPEDQELQALHTNRIRKEIKDKLFGSVEPSNDSLEWTHSLDWVVFKNKEKIVWEYVGSSNKNKRLQEAMRGLKSFLIFM